jgi:prepilin signal peptidase PulO-like enzyme (type II secretory pathway)
MTPPPFDALWFRLLAGLAVGLALGSFVTMLSYRLPRRLSIVSPGSFCPQCKTPLKTRDLVPVFSWLISGGKCRYCRVKIGTRYIFIELATALSSMAAFVLIGFEPSLMIALAGLVGAITFLTIAIKRY